MTGRDAVQAMVGRLLAPAYWMSGSSEGHEGENDAPREAAALITAQQAEIERLKDVIDVDRYKVAIGVEAVTKALNCRRWLSEGGRGPYAWDDERYQQEFGGAISEIDAALATLRGVSRDWSDSPLDPLRVAANRKAARAALAGGSDG